jgi:hypothetical protein
MGDCECIGQRRKDSESSIVKPFSARSSRNLATDAIA